MTQTETAIFMITYKVAYKNTYNLEEAMKEASKAVKLFNKLQ